MNAYDRYGYCEGDYRDPEFRCFGQGEPANSRPFNESVFFGSTRGGMDFKLEASEGLPWGASKLPAVAHVYGSTDWGWVSDKLYIGPPSRFYVDYPASLRKRCFREPVSGKDASLVGKPGGPLRVVLGAAGSFAGRSGYVLDVRGYLTETPFTSLDECR